MNERIKEWVEQCTVVLPDGQHEVNITQLASLVRADEREAIIDICEGVEVFDETMRTITEAIRQRGNHD